jgi:polyisoprenoid-binding protein YceI
MAKGCIIAATYAPAQQVVTRNGYIGFFSKAPLEDIKAETTQAAAVVDLSKKNLLFTALLKGFLFPKALMQEHFNENYVESDTYPKATFSRTYESDLDATANGTYNVQVKGELTLHGVTRELNLPATFQVQPDKLTGTAGFTVAPQDYNIRIPALVRDKIARQIAVLVNVEFQLSN